MRCKNCGAELPRGVKFCDICGEPMPVRRFIVTQSAASQKDKKRKGPKPIFKYFMAGCGIFIALILFISFVRSFIDQRSYEKWKEMNDLSGWETVITPEAYEKLSLGMTYEEVKEIVGGDGKLTYESDYSLEYSWPGKYYEEIDAHVDVYIDKDDVEISSIYEDSVVDGEDIIRFRRMKYNEYDQMDTPLITKEQIEKLKIRMDYDEVAEILGGDGVIVDSRRYISNFDRDATDHKYYAWKYRTSSDRIYYYEVSFENGMVSYLFDYSD